MAEIKTHLDDEELEELKKKHVARYDEYPRYKIPLLSKEERIALGKPVIDDKDLDEAFESSLKIYREVYIHPGIPIITTTEMMLLTDESAVGYAVGKEGNDILVVCEASGLSALSSVFGLLGNGNKSECSRFEEMCKNIDSEVNIMRMGICGYRENKDSKLEYIHHFRPIAVFDRFID